MKQKGKFTNEFTTIRIVRHPSRPHATSPWIGNLSRWPLWTWGVWGRTPANKKKSDLGFFRYPPHHRSYSFRNIISGASSKGGRLHQLNKRDQVLKRCLILGPRHPHGSLTTNECRHLHPGRLKNHSTNQCQRHLDGGQWRAPKFLVRPKKGLSSSNSRIVRNFEHAPSTQH
jgi:hypothetical protein